jgi:hypothetical protein
LPKINTSKNYNCHCYPLFSDVLIFISLDLNISGSHLHANWW